MKLKIFWLILFLVAPFLLLDCTYTPGSMAFNGPLGSSFQAGNPPDMVFVDSIRAGDFVKNGWLAPIPENVSTDGFQPELVAAFTFNGKVYALPHDVQPLALMVNPEIFKNHNLQYPQNWDELLNVVQILNSQGVYGIGLSPGLWNFLPFLYQAGGEILSQKRELMLNTDQARVALKYYAELGKNAYIAELNWPEQGSYMGDNGLLTQYIKGNVAVLVVGPGQYYAMKQVCQACPAEIIPLPEGPAGRATIAIVRGFGITPNGLKKGDGPARLPEFASSANGMSYWIGNSSDPLDFIPARPELRDKWASVHPEGNGFIESVINVRTFFMDGIMVDMVSRFDEQAGKILNDLLRNNLGYEQALPAMQQIGTQILSGQ